MKWVLLSLVVLLALFPPSFASMSSDDVEALRLRALGGDSESSFRLSEIYGDDNKLLDLHFWLRLSAEQGNCRALEELHRLERWTTMWKSTADRWPLRAQELECPSINLHR